MALDEKKRKILKLLIAVFIFIFVAISLFTYSESDPSFSNLVFTDLSLKVNNGFGKIGAYFADLMGTIFGWGALVFVIASIFVVRDIWRNESWFKLFSRFVSLFALSVFLAFFSGIVGEHDIFFKGKFAGGVLGIFSHYYIESFFGKIGGIILTFFGIIVSLFFALNDIALKGFDFSFIKKISFKRENKNVVSKRKKNKSEKKKEDVKDEQANEVMEIDKIIVEDDIKISPMSDVKEAKKMRYTVPIDLLDDYNGKVFTVSENELKRNAAVLEEKLRYFGVEGKVKDIQPGPVVTLYEFEPAPGIKISKIANLEDDLALAMSAVSVRIIAPIPGKSVVGIELPNDKRATVYLKELLASEQFVKSNSPLTIVLGKDISGKPYITDLTKMPHLLIAGTTGSGKSVSINGIICSILYKSSYEEVKFVMIDPKMVELSVYDGIPHLAAPVVVNPRKAANVLKNVVEEMEQRYALLAEKKVRNINSYNKIAEKEGFEKLPFLVVVVDEFADLMIVAGKEVEQAIIRIAQMARAVGIHLVLATQRPSVNVITGIIKANMPARLSFRVSSKTDSRTILDQNGAEVLLGKGDSLFIPPGSSEPIRIHGCFVSESEVNRVVSYLKGVAEPVYNMELVRDESEDTNGVDESELDDKYYEALELVKEKGFASISMIQRYLRIGYNRAARIVEIMERQGIIAPSDGTSKPREVLIKE
ncbi:DNA translocase FtsK [Deferribacter autotrophicus]|uniref:DNA translocase FtsK n=1 Tax=Deferribacter autotrophicus TaxID=500465 RepID=A0A5A8F003_9BACT|nr:DNA translocase FtsK [Deferribacter autotrophicus]KAA0257122.1 DNA translocase FtsK [Deferribacter autotrophicus]